MDEKGLATQKTRAHRHPMELPEAAKGDPVPHPGCVCESVCRHVWTHVPACVHARGPCENVCAYAYICMLVSLCVCVQYVCVQLREYAFVLLDSVMHVCV